MSESRTELTPFQLRLIAVTAVAVGVALIWAATSAVLVIFMGLLIGIVFTGVASLVARLTHLSYRWSILIVIVATLAVIVGAGFLLLPSISDQATRLQRELPEAWHEARGRIEQTAWGGRIIDHLQASAQAAPKPRTIITGVTGAFATLVGAVSGLLAAVFLGLFLSVEPQLYTRGFVTLFPQRRRRRAQDVGARVARVLRRWFFAKCISMSVVGVLTGLGLWALGVSLPIALAVIAAALTFVPNLGPVVAAVPALLLAFVSGPEKVLHVVLLYIGIQAVETYGITPFVERETVALPPALTLAGQLGLGLLAGIVGVIVATPLIAMLVVIVQCVYVQDILGDRAETPIGGT